MLLMHNAFSIPMIEQDEEPVAMENANKGNDNYRLPLTITPENYKLDIFTHLNDSEGFAFKGIVSITVRNLFLLNYFHF
jgi:hypothetical protein